MGIQYTRDGGAHRVATERGRGEVHANGQNFYGEDADVWVLHGEVVEEGDVGPQTDADAVDEQDWEFCARAVRAVPVRYVGLCVAGGTGEQCEERAWGEGVEPFAGIMMREAVGEECDGGEGIDEADDLPASSS